MLYKAKLNEALELGDKLLKEGSNATDVVVRVINILEDSPLFNAGKGAVFTHEETNELDASVMDGATLNAGAVTGVSRIKNPIDLALAVMDQSPHVMLGGKGAETFAEEKGFLLVDPSYFHTDKRYNQLQKIKEREKENTVSVSFEDPFIKDSKFGTVGCAALDKNGNLPKNLIPFDIREKSGVIDSLIRLSVGIEDIGDLLDDLKQAIG